MDVERALSCTLTEQKSFALLHKQPNLHAVFSLFCGVFWVIFHFALTLSLIAVSIKSVSKPEELFLGLGGGFQ